MPIDRTAFIDNYIDELNENLDRIDSGILILKNDQENTEEMNGLLRALHTIKGSSRMLKFNTIEKIAHGLETVFKGVKEGRYGITRPFIQLVFVSTDTMKRAGASISSKGNDDYEIEKLLGVFEKAYADEPYSLDDVKSEEQSEEESGGVQAGNSSSDIHGVVNTDLVRAAAEETHIDVQPADGSTEYETIRVKISKIDLIIKLLNNLIIRQFQFKRKNDILSELEIKLRELSSQRNSADIRGSAATAGTEKKTAGDCLKLVQQLKKGFSEELILLERNTFEVQEEILSLRMLPMELILGTLGKMVEETAFTLGKEIEFSIRGSEVMLDKLIIERLHDPLIHLIRNAIDHGIEAPAERERKGKAKAGKLEVECSSESASIVIRIRDDGQGIDYGKIREKAIDLYPIQEEDIRRMDDEALNSFLFTAGFSTRERVSDLSGRGVGLDIVRHNIEKIKGKISIRSENGTGTEFSLALPLSLATVDGFFVSAAGEKFLIPSTFVKEIIIAEEEQKLDLLSRKAIRIRDRIIPIYSLSTVMEREQTAPDGKLFVMVVESLGELIGIVVDSVIQYALLIYKPLPLNLQKLRLIQGIVFDENFNIITILYIPGLFRRFKRVKNIDTKKRFSAQKEKYRRILVVDDSFTTREIEKSILELEHYTVETAVDGIEGLEKLKEMSFHLVVTDIKMPRMDGFTLVENIRRDEKHRNVPIIVVSSVSEPESKQRFFAAGANSYIIKADFDRGNLVSEVRKLIG